MTPVVPTNVVSMATRSVRSSRSGRGALSTANAGHRERSFPALPRDDFLIGTRDPLELTLWHSDPYVVRDTPEVSPPWLGEDRREYHPSPVWPRPARTVSGRRGVTLRARDIPAPGWAVGFSRPAQVSICVRRSQRREVLHAYRVAGRRGLRPGRRNFHSAISCRR